MLSLSVRLIRNKCPMVSVGRYFHHEFTQPPRPASKQKESYKNETDPQSQDQPIISGAAHQKYKIFRDEDAVEIFDVEEERNRYQTHDELVVEQHNDYFGLNLKRGLNGVFDIEDLVDVLRKEGAEDVFVCSVPKDIKYVDYMVVCGGRSYRHMLATAEFVRRIYKIKRSKGDILPKIEGEKNRHWMALDLGNIALHIFSPKAREEYDLESLWAIGSTYDKECNKPSNPIYEMFEQQTKLLTNMETQ